MDRPRIGITTDNDPDAKPPGRYRLSRNYARSVALAGGVPLILPQERAGIGDYLELCDAIILTGGRDPRTEGFGEPTHPKARPLDPARQAFELALLEALAERCEIPVLGICLGMQMMALHAGGRLDQHLDDTLGEHAAARHRADNTHPIELKFDDTPLLEPQSSPLGLVTSCHHQAVADPGNLRLVATAPDGTIEAIDAPPGQRRFYVGVQWHPERAPAGSESLNQQVIQRLVHAARATTSAR